MVGKVLVRAARSISGRPLFRTSGQYWEDRYRLGGNSGAGSYSRLAEYKADVLNEFVYKNGIESVAELGCGDGAQLTLADYPTYHGYDVSQTIVEKCRRRFCDDSTKYFYTIDEPITVSDVALSLDVIYHLVEDAVFERYMEQLFAAASRFVVVYSSNFSGGSPADHVLHRRFTEWIEAHAPAWRLIEHRPNPFPFDATRQDDTSFCDFFLYERC